MATYDDEWFEVWYSGEDPIPVHFLVVSSKRGDFGLIKVVDPSKGNEVVFARNNYEEVREWLWEDEYHLIEGRQFPDDGWQ